MDAYGIPHLQHVWAKVAPHMAHPRLKARHLGTEAASEVCSAVGADIWSKGDDPIVLLRTRSWHAGSQVHQAGKYPDAQ